MNVWWEIALDNSPRHCWTNAKGKRILDAGVFGNVPCTKVHDPKLTDKVEWLRFIHMFGSLVTEDNNPFAGKACEKIVFNNGEDEKIQGITYTYAEEYYAPNGEITFKVHLNRTTKTAAIQCFREDLVEKCLKAYWLVEETYGEAART